MTTPYPTYEAAAKRADVLQKFYGMWVGVTGPYADGTYRISADPDDVSVTP